MIFTLVFLIFLKSQWIFLIYLYYLELSLTVLQNCRITAFVNLINSFEVQKSGKATTKLTRKSLKKRHRYIYWVYHWLGNIHGSRPPHPAKVTADLKSYL